MKKLHLPCVQGCSLNSRLIDSKTLVRELIFTYKCNNSCNCCHLPCRNSRTMSVGLALDIVRESADYAEQNGYKKMVLYFIGGEILDVMDEFKKFYESFKMLNIQMPVFIILETCTEDIPQEVKEWIINADNIHLSLRRTDSAESEILDKPADFGKKELYHRIYQKISKNNIFDICKDAFIIQQKFKMTSLPVYSNLSRLGKSDYEEYCRQLHFLSKYKLLDSFTVSEFSNCCSDNENSKRQIETIDTDGKRYFCKYMSPAYNLSSVYKKLNQQNDIPSSCKDCQAKDACELCPAARVLRNDSQCQMLRRQHYILLKSMQDKRIV